MLIVIYFDRKTQEKFVEYQRYIYFNRVRKKYRKSASVNHPVFTRIILSLISSAHRPAATRRHCRSAIAATCAAAPARDSVSRGIRGLDDDH